MFHDLRKNKLFLLIDNHPKKYSSEQIGRLLSISPRTVRKEIKEINGLLNNSGISIENKRGEGYYLSILDYNFYREFKQKHEMTGLFFDVNLKEERFKQIILTLFQQTDYITIEELAEQLFVSRTTVTNDLNQVADFLKMFDLELNTKVGKGINIIGKENDKRSAILSLFDETLDEDKLYNFFAWNNEEFYVNLLEEKLPLLFSRYHLYTTDDQLRNLIYHILIMIDRIRKHMVIEEIRAKPKAKEFQQLIEDLRKFFNHVFQIEVPSSEMDYLYIQISSKIILEPEFNEQFKLKVNKYINLLLEKINENYCYDLSNDEQLKKDLAKHIQAMLYRVENQIRVRNPMKEHIKKYYPLAYEVTFFAVDSLKDEFSEINQSEIAYLALHIGASLERNYHVKYERHSSCLIVCGSGFGTARMIETTIKQTMPDLFVTKTISAQKYSQLGYIEEDVVITTVEIEKKNKPIYRIDTLPSKKTLIELNRKITSEIKNDIDIFDKYFSPSLFFREDFKNKEELIETVISSLKRENVIDDQEEFKESVLKREKLGSTIVGDGIAIPHPLNLLAKRTKIAVAIPNKPMKWENLHSVQLVFILAISKNDYEDALSIYDYLVDIVRENNIQILVDSGDYNAFLAKSRKIMKG